LARLALRFLHFGALAWGGPVVQIAALHRELVERERWVDEARFRKILAVYQALPGPEATELCIWFGALARGRLGGLVAGVCFVLPGLAAMLLASWLLLELDPWPPALVAAFAGMRAAVVALVARAAWRLFGAATRGSRVLTGIAAVTATAAVVVGWTSATGGGPPGAHAATAAPGALALLATGLRSGLLTFGGAYTVIPLLAADACGTGGWMTQAQFASGVAVGSVIPAPMVILGTWVGWAGGGLGGALLVTFGIFAPAFACPLLLHAQLERLVQHRRLHALLDGITAAVVGLVVAVAIELAAMLDSPLRLAIAVAALLALARWHGRFAVLPVLATAAVAGLLGL
jgi:chromate transporter